MQPNKFHIKPTRLSKAALFLQSLPSKEEINLQRSTLDYTRSQALQNEISEAFIGHGPPVSDMEFFRYGPKEFNYHHYEEINDVTYSFDITVNNGYMSVYWDRGGQTTRNDFKSQGEGMKAMSIIARMGRQVFTKHRSEINQIYFSADVHDSQKIRLYKILAEKFAREFGGKVEYDRDYIMINFPQVQGRWR